MTTDTFAEHCRGIAQRFLQTAIVVDDRAFKEQHETTIGKVVAPRRRPPMATDAADTTVESDHHDLDTRTIIEEFAALDIICSVIGPTRLAMSAIRQADIVVLDWRLKDDDPEFALNLLASILTEEPDRNALRLVGIYTGEPELQAIQDDIVAKLKEEGLDADGSEAGTVTYGHGRVVLYAKPSVNLPTALQSRETDESELPQRLVNDFSKVTAGLLPSIALVSLTAVRECAHMVLDQFCAELDPAFLAHRACLTDDPDDAERQMVGHIAEELRGLMDYAVAHQRPAGRQPITNWIREQAGDPPRDFQFEGRALSFKDTVALATNGLENQGVLGRKRFECLSAGFGGGESRALDERLAWIMSSRTVFNAPPPRLWLGTVVRKRGSDDDQESLLICLRPRCDSVRLPRKTATSFAFLPLGEPCPKYMQIVVRLGDSYQRQGITMDASGWKINEFKPDNDGEPVLARRERPMGTFMFIDAAGREYEWLGELKAEFAHRVAQTFADKLSRPAVDDSEWLRRLVKG